MLGFNNREVAELLNLFRTGIAGMLLVAHALRKSKRPSNRNPLRISAGGRVRRVKDLGRTAEVTLHKSQRASCCGVLPLLVPHPGVPQNGGQDPPELPWSPEIYPMPYPDRPLSSRVTLQEIGFDAMPEDWEARSSGVSLSAGSGQLRISKGVA